MQNSLNSNTRLEEQFAVIAKQFPKRIALSLNGLEMTYEELDQKSDVIADLLKDRLKEDTKYVGLLMNRGMDMIVSVLGILKAGVAYIPIDPVNNPIERTKLCLSEANLKWVVTDRKLAIKNVKTLIVGEDTYNNHKLLPGQEVTRVKKQDIAYAIFTSGSTGVPKAVPIRHGNVLSMFQNSTKIFEFTKDDTWALFHSIAFDFSVWEIWGALLFGARLEIVPYAVSKNTPRFRRFLIEKKITVLNQTTGAFHSLIKTDQIKGSPIATLRCLIFGGEKTDMQLLESWINRYAGSPTKLFTVYGTTETTIFSTVKYLDQRNLADKELCPIGTPIPGQDLVLIGEDGQVSSEGEIYISGERLSEGYLNRPELNKKKFHSRMVAGEILNFYKTGDLAFEKDGEYYFVGRADSQVKFNGYRIELEEIQNITMSHPEVMRSIAMVDRTLAYPRLINFLEPIDPLVDGSRIKEEVKNRAENLLPFYMVPSEFVVIDEIPLTTNGKIDYRKLSEGSKAQTDELALAY